MSRRSINKEPYPYNLLVRIFDCTKEEVEEHLKTKDIEDVKMGIEFVFGEVGGRWKEFLLKYYKQNMTYREISNEYNFSLENARQVVTKYTRRIKHFSNLKYILYGYDGITKYKKDKIDKQKKLNSITGVDGIEIQELDGLSFRAFNALKRAGVKTLSDIQSRKQLLGIRNLGKKSADEIIKILTEYGKQIN